LVTVHPRVTEAHEGALVLHDTLECISSPVDGGDYDVHREVGVADMMLDLEARVGSNATDRTGANLVDRGSGLDALCDQGLGVTPRSAGFGVEWLKLGSWDRCEWARVRFPEVEQVVGAAALAENTLEGGPIPRANSHLAKDVPCVHPAHCGW